MRENSVWVLEDDPGCRYVYDQILALRYSYRSFENLEDFRVALNEEKDKPHLVIADLRLPDGDFIDFLSASKESVKNIAYIVVSSTDDLDILRECFTKGALDYLTKPFSKAELTVKVERLIKTRGVQTQSSGGPVTQALPNGVELYDLTKKEFLIYRAFMDAPGRCLDRDQLIQAVWKDVSVTPKTLDVHLFNLRKKTI